MVGVGRGGVPMTERKIVRGLRGIAASDQCQPVSFGLVPDAPGKVFTTAVQAHHSQARECDRE